MFAAISLTLLALLGLGAGFAIGLGGVRRWRDAGAAPAVLLGWLSVAWLAGLQTAYAIGVLVADLRVGLAVIGGFAVVGAAVGAVAFYLCARRCDWRRAELVFLAIIVVMAALYFLSIVGTPIRVWDARSIWFFHAKVIFHDGGLVPSLFWMDNTYDWSHKDYPKMIPLFAAGVAQSVGYWNEYVPKVGLFALLVPALAGYAAACRLRLAYLVPLGALCGCMGGYLWNGYVDAYVAVVAMVAGLAGYRWLRSGQAVDAMLCLLATGVTMGLKQEGLIVAASLLAAMLCTVRFPRPWLRPAGPRRGRIIAGAAILILTIGPMIAWRVKVMAWSLHGDMPPAQMIAHLAARVTDPARLFQALGVMADHAVANTYVAEALIASLVLAAFTVKRGLMDRAGLFVLLIAWAYAGAVVLIYLGTPHDFQWHIETSFTRVTLTVVGLCLIGHLIMLRALWRGASVGAPVGEGG